MGRGYSGNHPRFSHRQDERYDAKEAYNKDLTASARLHYLENDRHDHESPAHSHCSPMHMHNDRHIRRQAEKIARKNEGDVQDIYYELKAKAAQDQRSGRKKVDDERSGEIRNQMIDEMLDDRPDSPMMNTGEGQRALDSIRTNKLFFQRKRDDDQRGMNQLLSDNKVAQYINPEAQAFRSIFNTQAELQGFMLINSKTAASGTRSVNITSRAKQLIPSPLQPSPLHRVLMPML